MKNQQLFLIVGILLFLGIGVSCINNSGKNIVNLKTEYQVNPLGIDISEPTFSWQMEAVGKYGATQTAYQVLVSESEEQLKDEDYVYDSGRISSGLSVSIPYKGTELKPSTRYFWKVRVWDEEENVVESKEEAWFETALMDNNWDNAQWIGSDRFQFSKYRADGVFEFDFQVDKGSSQAVFVFCNRDENNFIALEFNMEGANKKPELKITHTVDGIRTEDYSINLYPTIGAEQIYDRHHVKMNLTAGRYYSQCNLDLEVDGKSIKDVNKKQEDNPFARMFGGGSSEFSVSPLAAGSSKPFARIYAIGFKQPNGQNATFSNLKITETKYGVTLYQSDKTYLIEGTDELQTWYPGEDVSAPMLRKTFELDKSIKQARLYSTARGIYEMSINGQAVANDFMNPGWTDYRYRIMYNVYDVTKLLKQGSNAVGALLGTGWYSDFMGYQDNWRDQYGIEQSLLAKLVVEYSDGTTETIVTDNSWQVSDQGPITSNSFLNGVDYDARKELTGWDEVDYDATDWKKATIIEAPAKDVILQAYVGSPVRVEMERTAVKMTEPLKNTYVYDMGQNMVGIPKLKLKGTKGQEITVRYAEMVYPDVIPTEPTAPLTVEDYIRLKGQMYTDNLRGALATDHYICKGDELGEVFEPHFTLHGFRYIEIVGLDTPLAVEDVKVLVLNSLQESESSTYETSDSRINQLFSNIQWGQRGNFVSIPTDCPQRDERLGWTGDAQIFSRASTYNANVNPFFKRWLYSLRDGQGQNGEYGNYLPGLSSGSSNDSGFSGGGAFGWSDAGVIIPWQVYQQYGDISVLEQSYESMKFYMQYIEGNATDFIQPTGGYADWLSLVSTVSDLTNTAYFGYDAQIMAKIAAVLGETEDQKKYEQLFENIKIAFNERFLDGEGNTLTPIGSAIGNSMMAMFGGSVERTTETKILNTQTSLAVPLYFNLINENVMEKAAANLAKEIENNNYSLNTGFLGTPCLTPVLSDYGYDDVAYKLFQQNSFPSWLYSVEQGATTIWERWNSYTLKNGFGDVNMNSYNHYSYGAVEEWMIAYSAGIQRDESNPGYKHILLRPHVGGNFTHINASYNSVYGKIESGWVSDNQILNSDTDAAAYGYTYSATVPANTSATLTLPVINAELVEIIEGKEGVTFISSKNGKSIYELKSGNFEFKININ